MNGLALIFKEALERYEKYKRQETETSVQDVIRFNEDPPCIRQLLQQGVIELGTTNSIQYRLSAFFKLQGLNIAQTIALMDEWVMNITSDKTHEILSDGRVDYASLKKQNRYVCNTVFASSNYGFSCAGIKQIDGIVCDPECKKDKIVAEMATLFDVSRVDFRHKRIAVDVEVVGRRDSVMIIPKTITAKCNASLELSTKCSQCVLKGCPNGYIVNVDSNTRNILQFLEPSNIPLSGRVARMLGMTRRDCATWSYKVTEQNVEKVFVSPRLTNETFETDRYTKQEAYYIGHGIKTAQSYRLSGYTHVSEKDGEVVLVFDKADELADSLSEFVWTKEMSDNSLIFRTDKPSVRDKLDYIIERMNLDVFNLWGREDMLKSIYLAFHSLRKIPFQKRIINGWMDILIIGDSGQGKSHAIECFMKHYKAGFEAAAESLTRAGLLWGIDVKGNGPPSLIWGAIPRYSGRIVIIDEAASIVKEDGAFAAITEARSKGVVNVNAIVSGSAVAETRLITMTNPSDKLKMNTFLHPVEAIPQLIPAYQDIRRFTLAVGVMSNEIKDEDIHRDTYDIPDMDSEFTSERCSNLLYWAWSLKPEDIIFTHDVQKVVLDLSLLMCKTYSSEIPLVEPADQRHKLARVSAAFAAGTFSSPDGVKCEITEACVIAAHDFLNDIYRSKALDYEEYSLANAKLIIAPEQMKELVHNFTHNSTWAAYI